ncbi:MAG: intradiol ring-cleavage dioxygenase [Bythopirellula sp.]
MSHQVRRRQFIQRGLVLGSTALWTPGVFAEQLTRTPRQTEGPFYPDRLPLDTDNDLLIVNDQLTPAVGDVTHLSGRVLDTSGAPMKNVVVEIWQVDNQGLYIHTESARRGDYDTNFQGFGRFLTNRKGEYYFRTIKPIAYGPRTPHIHFAVNQGDRRLLTTQCYIQGDQQNKRDDVLGRIQDAKLREALMVDFKPMADSPTGELVANFDIVLGLTPES